MKNLRKYGKPPFRVAVIHGGPGAAGEMQPVARELASNWGILEPLQSEITIKGQVEELKSILGENGDPPIILMGFSWGAWLSFIFSAEYPSFVKKLILVASGPFEEKYALAIQKTRLERLNKTDREEAESLIGFLDELTAEDRSKIFRRFGELFSKADAYDPLPQKSESVDLRADIFQSVLKEAEELRRSGQLLKLGKNIKCPVVAIHGDYDPHPAEGVRRPLSSVLKNFRFIQLKNCGHKPWIERKAKERFFRILREELVQLKSQIYRLNQ
ncbi:MAG TPA: alpha/beta hydrolase [Terriglobales bacterium]|nr:alpha/beta hydrolase [Terriglobales bacterium]